MLKILLIVALVIVAMILCVLVVAAFKPSRFTVTRSIVIQASPEKVFALINDLHRWQDWSADAKEDPNAKETYSGPPAGTGAISEWEGKQGKVRLEILESSPKEIRVQADWMKPFAARNINLFQFEPQSNGTRVTWSLDGENVFMLKVMTVFMSADKIMGSHFEKGLASLKTLAEQR